MNSLMGGRERVSLAASCRKPGGKALVPGGPLANRMDTAHLRFRIPHLILAEALVWPAPERWRSSMSGWSSTGGWNAGACGGGWRVRREAQAGLPRAAGRWTAPDIAVTVVAFLVHWEVGLAFLALKLWQQSSGYQGSVFAFARDKWEGLVAATRALTSGAHLPFSLHVGPRSSGNHAFDVWREAELAQIDAERTKLRTAERDFAAYRDDLLHAKDREDFERFMQSRQAP